MKGGYIKNRITLWDWKRPIKDRHSGPCGPYYFNPGEPIAKGQPEGFSGYTDRWGTEINEGSSVRLRVEPANDHLALSRLRFINGYYCDEFQGQTLQPVIARLPKNRGYLAGWTMGPGMSTSFSRYYIYDDIEDAARAAHSEAEYAAERQREYDERERERIEQEEQQDADKYRQEAMDFCDGQDLAGGCSLSIDPRAPVEFVDGGAWIDARVFIPTWED